MDKTSMILGLIAGLGFFLYGMKLMSDGLEKVAGTKMKSILEMCTKNRFIGVIVGILFTAVIQSSSAATVMIVSFVNAGLMSLLQAIGPIMGANIGTTVTGQLVSINLDAIAPVFIFAGVIMIMFFKKPTIKNVGDILLGLGILFFGMTTMKEAMSDLSSSQQVQSVIASLKNPFLAILVGFVITTVIQSSSASVGILIAMSQSGILSDLQIVFFVILGCNIGSCMSAVLASLSGKKDAKRAAMIHMIFNIIGSIVLVCIILPFGGQIQSMIEKISIATSPEGISVTNLMARDVANAHTIFKVFQVLILFPFGKLIVKLTYLVVPGEDEKKEGFELKYINSSSIATPSAAIIETIREVKRMGKKAANNLELSFEALMTKDIDLVEKVLKNEQEIDFLSGEITDYLVAVNQISLPVKDAKNIAGYFHVVSDLERIGDHAENLAEFARTRINDKIEFTEQGEQELKEIFDKAIKIVYLSIETFVEQSEEHLKEIVDLENEIDKMEKEFQHSHIRRLSKNQCSPKASIFSDLLSNFERVSDHATNIAFAIYDDEQYDI